MTTTGSRPLEAILAHHAQLADGVARRVIAISAVAEAGEKAAAAAAELLAYLAEDVLPHAVAEEHTIYRAAADKEELATTVAAMVGEHRRLAALIEHLAIADDARTAAKEAEAIGTLFAAHVAKENELLLPALAADETVDLGALLAKMHHLTEAATEVTTTEDGVSGPDTEGRLLALLLDAAGQLARIGEGDPACRLTAAAWASLHVARPDLAVRVTAALHRLVRSVTEEPVAFTASRSARTGKLDGLLDVRVLAPAQRHEQIFAAYAALDPGSAFVLVNDHDPKPLRYQFEAEHAGRFTWEYLEAGPRTWRVRIGRAPHEVAR